RGAADDRVGVEKRVRPAGPVVALNRAAKGVNGGQTDALVAVAEGADEALQSRAAAGTGKGAPRGAAQAGVGVLQGGREQTEEGDALGQGQAGQLAEQTGLLGGIEALRAQQTPQMQVTHDRGRGRSDVP